MSLVRVTSIKFSFCVINYAIKNSKLTGLVEALLIAVRSN